MFICNYKKINLIQSLLKFAMRVSKRSLKESMSRAHEEMISKVFLYTYLKKKKLWKKYTITHIFILDTNSKDKKFIVYNG